MSREMTLDATISLSPQQVAEAFWDMASDEQADFFAHLESIAGVTLCIQMAAVVRELQERSDNGDRVALTGFQTMLAHSQAYAEESTDYRTWNAKREIERTVKGAKHGEPK